MLVTGPFAQILEANRARFNARFAEARHIRTKLTPGSFTHHLRTGLAPIVEAVHRHNLDIANAVADALYDLSLDLVGQELLGPESRYPYLVEGWNTLLPRLPRFVAEAPRQFVGSVTNALYNLSVTPGARPREWMEAMLALADLCPDAETLLKTGQVVAWRAGLAHYRLNALELCTQLASLNPALAYLALGLPTDPSINAPPVTALLDRLLADPWWRPTSDPRSGSLTRETDLQIVSRIGAFRGFGGLFMSPPVVLLEDGHFVLEESGNYWLLTADVFGATLHRWSKPGRAARSVQPFQIDPNGVVTNGKHSRAFPELAGAASAAASPTTLAVTTALSHAVFLVALAHSGRR
jgi:hypothetical protein